MLPSAGQAHSLPPNAATAWSACFSARSSGSLKVLMYSCTSMCPRPSTADRYRSLRKASEIALTKCTAESVFQEICDVLKEVVPYDRAGLSLYDPDHDSLRIVDIYGPHENSIFLMGHLLGRKTCQTGWVFENKQTLFRRDLAAEFKFPSDRRIVDEGYRSICSVPLVVRGNSIGVLSVIGSRENQLSIDHAEMVEEVSRQVALAVASIVPRCPTHTHTKVVCPRCIGAAGGKTTVSRHREDLSHWGRMGGRGRKSISVE